MPFLIHLTKKFALSLSMQVERHSLCGYITTSLLCFVPSSVSIVITYTTSDSLSRLLCR